MLQLSPEQSLPQKILEQLSPLEEQRQNQTDGTSRHEQVPDLAHSIHDLSDSKRALFST